MNNNFKLGIDTSNISSGGRLTHIAELLNAATPSKYGFSLFTIKWLSLRFSQATSFKKTNELNCIINLIDRYKSVKYHGEIPYDSFHEKYRKTDLAINASYIFVIGYIIILLKRICI